MSGAPQLDLFAATFAQVTHGRECTERELTLAAKFSRFHLGNPQVYATLVRLARRRIGHGHKRIGIAALFEVARWELSFSTTGEEFKLNNSYRAFYARLIMAQEPDLDGIFETRTQRAA